MISKQESEKIRQEIERLNQKQNESSLLDQHIDLTLDRQDSKKQRAKHSFTLTEGMIRYAHEHTYSNQEAARLLQVDIRTLKKYAKMYIDKETGLDLWQKHIKTNKQRRSKVKKKTILKGRYRHTVEEILGGKPVGYDRWTVLRRLLLEGYVKEECSRCGYNERRVTDYCVPLTLGFKDGNKRNFHIDNIEIVCLNCYYHYYGHEALTIKDFRSYQAHYSDYVRKQIVEKGELKYSNSDAHDEFEELDVADEMGWERSQRKWRDKNKKDKTE